MSICISDGFCFVLYSSAHAMMKAYAPLLKKLDLTYPQFLVLFALWERDKRTVSDLGETLFLDSGTLTPLLKRMEKAGLVKRMRNPADERQVFITLTPKSRAMQAEGVAIANCFHEATGHTPDELAPVRKQLKEVRDRLLKSVAGE
jgi:MarR family transcriptional regulator, organic hydroperoxide resistance regulator